MFATIRRYRLNGGSMDSLLHEVDVGFAEMIQEKEGFVAYEVLDHGDGHVTTISTFADRDAAEATTGGRRHVDPREPRGLRHGAPRRQHGRAGRQPRPRGAAGPGAPLTGFGARGSVPRRQVSRAGR